MSYARRYEEPSYNVCFHLFTYYFFRRGERINLALWTPLFGFGVSEDYPSFNRDGYETSIWFGFMMQPFAEPGSLVYRWERKFEFRFRPASEELYR